MYIPSLLANFHLHIFLKQVAFFLSEILFWDSGKKYREIWLKEN